MIFHMSLDLYGFVGIIMLIGIVKKNAIMMIDFALDAERKEGTSAAEAIYQGCLVRFRPIMMTTMAALMGTLPIAVGTWAGADSRRPLGLAVVRRADFSRNCSRCTSRPSSIPTWIRSKAGWSAALAALPGLPSLELQKKSSPRTRSRKTTCLCVPLTVNLPRL